MPINSLSRAKPRPVDPATQINPFAYLPPVFMAVILGAVLGWGITAAFTTINAARLAAPSLGF